MSTPMHGPGDRPGASSGRGAQTKRRPSVALFAAVGLALGLGCAPGGEPAAPGQAAASGGQRAPGSAAASAPAAPPSAPESASLADASAARARFDEALRAELDGDAWLAEEHLLTLATRYPDTPHGLTARHRLTGGGGPFALMTFSGISAAIAIPTFQRYVARSKTAEASLNVRRIAQAARFYEPEVAADGTRGPRFPDSVGLTPPTSACVGTEAITHPPDPALWRHPTWRALGFEISEPSRYQYRAERRMEGDTAVFVVQALGDLDCDGVYSTFERTLRADPKEDFVVDGFQEIDELE